MLGPLEHLYGTRRYLSLAPDVGPNDIPSLFHFRFTFPPNKLCFIPLCYWLIRKTYSLRPFDELGGILRQQPLMIRVEKGPK